MNIAYINKTVWLANMPSTVFSTLNSYAFAENGHDTTVIFKTPPKSLSHNFEEYFGLPLLENFHVHTEPDKMLFIKANEIFYRNINKWLCSFGKKWDVVITRDPGYLPYLYSLKQAKGIKAFYQSHNFYLNPSLQPEQSKINQKKFKLFERRYIPRIDGLLTINNPQKELYEKYINAPICACHPGLKEVHEAEDNFDNQLIFYSGSFQQHKGIELLIKAFAEMKNKQARLVLAGGRNENELRPVRELINTLNLNERANITGWLSYTELEKLLSSATVGVLPLQDTFYNRYLTAPSKLFDYFAFGVPVIASNLPAIRDFITDCENGIFISPGDEHVLAAQLDALLCNKSKYLQLQNNTIETAKQFLWKDCAKKMLDFMNK